MNFYEELNEISENELIDDILNSIINTYKSLEFQKDNSMYILPDGTLLDLGNSGYGHSDLAKYLADCGIEQNYKEGNASEFLYSKGWIRINNKYKFITIPNVPLTEIQYAKLIELFDMYKKDYQVTTLDHQYKTYNDRTSDEVVNLIKRYYVSGILYENFIK